MGTASSNETREVAVHSDVVSPGHPGERSCISDPLDAACRSPDALLDELLEILLDPTDETERYVIKELEVTTHSADSRTVRVIHDGKRLKLHGQRPESEGDEDQCTCCATVDADRERQEVVSRRYNPLDGACLQSTTTLRLLLDPLRLEAFVEEADGTRKSGRELAGTVQRMYLRPALLALATKDLAIRSTAGSPCGGGASALTARLDGRTTFDDLFGGLLTMLKRDALAKGATIDYPSEREVEMEYGTMFVTIYHDRESGAITVDEFPGRVHGAKLCLQVLREPELRVQAHVETSEGRRLAGRGAAGVLRSTLGRLLDREPAPDE